MTASCSGSAAGCFRRREVEKLGEAADRQHRLAQLQDLRPLDEFDAMLAAGDADRLHHRMLRQGEALAAGFDDQRRRDGERQRDLERKTGSMPRRRGQGDRAADRLDVLTHDIHADAAAGDIGDLFGGREARREDESVDFLVAHPFELRLGRQPQLQRLFLDPRLVEATPVVADFDGDLAGLVRGGDPHRPGRRLAEPHALVGALQPMVGAIAHEMGERIADQLDQLAVEFGVAAVGDQIDLLVQLGAKIADHARQIGEHALHRLHAGAHHGVLQVGGQGGQALERRLQRFIVLVARDLHELIARQHQLRHQLHDALERVEIDPDRLGALALRRLGALRGGRRGACPRGRGHGRAAWFRRRRRRRRRHDGPQIGILLGDGVRRRRLGSAPAFGDPRFEQRDHVFVVAFAFGALLLQFDEQRLDAVHRGENGGNDIGRRRGALAQRPDQTFRGMGQPLKPGQAEEAASALDGVNKSENAGDEARILRMTFESHDLRRRRLDLLARFGEEFFQHFIHGSASAVSSMASSCCRACSLAPGSPGPR